MNRAVRFALLAAVAALPLTALPALAFWSHDVTVNTPVAVDPTIQFGVKMVPDGSGGVFVVWWDARTPPSLTDIYGQHYDALGRELWTANGKLLVGGTGYDAIPRVVLDGQGGIIVAYARIVSLATPLDQDILIQRFDVNGTPQWTAGGVVISTVLHEIGSLEMVSDGQNGAICAWTDNRTAAQYDLFVQRVKLNGLPLWTSEGVPICTAAGNQMDFKMVQDGIGGAYLVWEDPRTGTKDIYLEHVDPSGTRRYGASGLGICTAAGNQSEVDAVTDGQAGVVAAWTDERGADADVYAQRVKPSGAAWAPNGVAVISFTGTQVGPTLVFDGDGGAFVAWTDGRTANLQVRAQRMDGFGFPEWVTDGVQVASPGKQRPNGVTDNAGGMILVYDDFRDASVSLFAQRLDPSGVPQWTANGVPVTRAPDQQDAVSVVSDGRNGAIVAWEDRRRDGFDTDLYAERVEGFGFVGTPEPVIASALDVPNDQGGKVKLSWYGSWPELPPTNAIDVYHIFRSVPPNAAQKLRARGVRVVSAEEGCASNDCLLATPNGTMTDFWEYVGTQNAFDLPAYSYLVPTTGDSIEGSNPLTKFLVQCRSNTGPQFWNSQPDSGYSADDLAPATPSPFTGSYDSGTSALQWGANHESDLAGYRLHRGHSPGFVPSAVNLVTSTTSTDFDDAAGAPFYYKLAAFDAHGNLSGYALLLPTGTVDAPQGSLPIEIALAPVQPNPSRGRVQFRVALPTATALRLSVYDTQGREVRRIADENRAAGEHTMGWDERDASGHSVRPGIYVVRLSVAGREWSRRFALIR